MRLYGGMILRQRVNLRPLPHFFMKRRMKLEDHSNHKTLIYLRD